MNVSVWILKFFNENTPEKKRIYFAFVSWIFIIFLVKTISFKAIDDGLDYSNTNFKVLGLNLPANLSFAGEKVPLNDFEIKES